MSQAIPSPRHLEELFQNMEDGCITGSEHEELMALLRVHASVRAAYLKHMEFAGLLHLKAEALAELESAPLHLKETTPSRQFFRSTLAAAAVIALAAYLATFFILPDPPAASVTAGPDTSWKFETGGLDDGSGFVPGTILALDGGTLDIHTGSGSRMVVEGPAQILISGPDKVRMPYGRIWVRAGSERFVVHTKRLKIIDLGTEFGVLASPSLDEEVHVADGRVRVEPVMRTLKPVEITAGQAVRANIVGKLRPALYDAGSFQTELPKQAPYLHWSFDKPENGQFPSSGIGLEAAPISVYSLDDPNAPLEPSSEPGRFGQALRLGQPGRFAQADFPGIDGNLPRTVALWVKGMPSEAPTSLALACWGLATEFGTKWVVATRSDGRAMSTGWGGAWTGSSVRVDRQPILDGEWHHLAYVFTGRVDADGRPAIIHYLDGEPLSLDNAARSHPVNTDCNAKNSWVLTLGTQLFSDPQRPTFVGSIDELYVFRGALDASQIRRLASDNLLEERETSAVTANSRERVE